jgi:hypothetical protein
MYIVANFIESISFCYQLLNPMGIHLLRYAHGGERIASHDDVWNVFVSIVKDVRFYVLWEAFSLVFLLVDWHCFVSWWHLHIG